MVSQYILNSHIPEILLINCITLYDSQNQPLGTLFIGVDPSLDQLFEILTTVQQQAAILERL